MACPGVTIADNGQEVEKECSGHGVCHKMRRLASRDSENKYRLWDRDAIQGCDCDPGYAGGDCSQRLCGFGIDPLYFDDSSTLKTSVFNFALLTTATTIDMVSGPNHKKEARWGIVIFDQYGEDWITQPFPLNAPCSLIVETLEQLPNRVIPQQGVVCYRTTVVNQNPLEDISYGDWNLTFPSKYEFHVTSPETFGTRTEYIIYRPTFWEAGFANSYDVASGSDTVLSGYIYRLEFIGVPGYLKEPLINTYTDGAHTPTMYSPGGKLFTKVWTDGEQGEFTDYVSEHCDDLIVTVTKDNNNNYYITGLTHNEADLLFQCLGDADGDPTNNVDIHNWDHGDEYNPHLFKLVPTTANARGDWGFYCVGWFDTTFNAFTGGLTTGGTLRILNPFRSIHYNPNTIYNLYTTSGVLSLTSSKSEVVFDYASNVLYTFNINFDKNGNGDTFNGDISCDNYDENDQNSPILSCLAKNDLFLMFDFNKYENNPSFLNIYRVKKIYSLPETEFVGDDYSPNSATGMRASSSASYRVHRIITDLSTNWAHDIDENSQFRIYKFTPSKKSNYEVVAPCSNRGVCNHENGLCECHDGYTGAQCSQQISLAM